MEKHFLFLQRSDHCGAMECIRKMNVCGGSDWKEKFYQTLLCNQFFQILY